MRYAWWKALVPFTTMCWHLSQMFANHCDCAWVVCTVKKEDRKKAEPSQWKAFALYSGAVFQLAACIVVFSFLGYRLAIHTHHNWFTIIGVIVGIIVGASGLVFLAKQILGDKP